MLITVCYTVLTWLHGRKRSQVLEWVEEACNRGNETLLLIRDRLEAVTTFQSNDYQLIGGSTCSSPSSTIAKEVWKKNHRLSTIDAVSLRSISDTQSLSSLRQPQASPLCYNRDIRTIRLITETSDTRMLAISPYQIVELHDWTSFVSDEKLVDSSPSKSIQNNQTFFHILLEAEPALHFDKNSFRKFWKFGETVAWKCDAEFALILKSSLEKLVELMHLFRISELLLDGGWRVYRLTTIHVEGSVGTLISKKGFELTASNGVTPADLRRLSAGIYDCTEYSGASPSPKASLSKDTSKYNIPRIVSEDSLCEREELEDRVEISAPLINWYERSPKKKSIATIHYTERATLPRRKSSLSSLSQKSSSLASLLFCSKSISFDAESSPRKNYSVTTSPLQTPDKEKPSRSISSATPTRATTGRLSYDTLNNIEGNFTSSSRKISLSTSTVDEMIKKNSVSGRSGLSGKNLLRTGKPPNILVLCQDEKMRQKIVSILNTMIASDRYIIYEIRWDQVKVGGWADQTALLVLSGPIPEPDIHLPVLLQFLGDGGRLFAWCAESVPFGIPGTKEPLPKKSSIIYSGTQTRDELVIRNGWGVTKEINCPPPPSGYARILETNDSEGISRPLTVSVFGKSKEGSEAVILQLDGGALGGKAILSQINFEESVQDQSSQALLSLLLSGTLGLDCRRIKTLDYSQGYFLGDHTRIQAFLKEFPSKINQPQLTLDFVPRGEKGPSATHQLFPIHHFVCPKNFSTLDYFDVSDDLRKAELLLNDVFTGKTKSGKRNLQTKDLGRLLIYTDVVSSVMNVVSGNPLCHGLTVVARQQTSGRGRGKNVWLSPEGCALYAFQLHVPRNDTGIGRRLSLVQQLAALSVVLTVPDHKEIELYVKWPNDIYLAGQKIGGILVESQMDGRQFIVNIGIGVNISNSYPTTSLNAVLGKKSQLSIEAFLGKSLTEFEKLLNLMKDDKGLEEILKIYVDNWIHQIDDEVSVEVSEGKFAMCKLRNIDDYGFLRVTEVSTGNTFSVQPDGNSFDIANRLISIKQ